MRVTEPATTDPGDEPDRLRARVELWVREVAGLGGDATVRVEERACARSGWPPYEVAIAVESAHGWHERLVHKRLAGVTRLDVAGAWRGGDSCCGP